MVIWVCEASEVNNLTVLAVGPNHRDDVLRRLYPRYASSGSDPPKGSDKNPLWKNLLASFEALGEVDVKLTDT